MSFLLALGNDFFISAKATTADVKGLSIRVQIGFELLFIFSVIAKNGIVYRDLVFEGCNT